MVRKVALSEAEMLAIEQQIPELATAAGRAAYQEALSRHGFVTMKSAGGRLVEHYANGQERLIKVLPPGTPVRQGLVLRKRPGSAA